MAMIFVACTKEEDDVRFDLQLSTMKVMDITFDPWALVATVTKN